MLKRKERTVKEGQTLISCLQNYINRMDTKEEVERLKHRITFIVSESKGKFLDNKKAKRYDFIPPRLKEEVKKEVSLPPKRHKGIELAPLTLYDIIFVSLFVFITLWFLTNLNGGLLRDEARFAITGYYILNKHILLDLGISYNPPLIKYIVGFSQLLGGTTSFAIRLPSTLFALGILTFVYLIARKLWSGLVGIVATIILVNSKGFYQYAVIAYLDMGMAFFAISTVTIYLFVKRPAVKYSLMGVTSALMICSKYTGVYVLVAIAIFIFYDSYRMKRLSLIGYFSLFFAASTAVILSPYLLHYKEYFAMLSMASTEYKRGATKAYAYLGWFLNDWVRYGPHYFIGLLATILYYLASRNHEKRFIAFVCLIFFVGVSLFQRHYRFILPDLPYLALMFSGFFYDIFQYVQLKYFKELPGKLSASLIVSDETTMRGIMVKLVTVSLILFIILTPLAGATSLGKRINIDSGADRAAFAILSYVNNTESHRVVVLTQSLPNLLYYLSADPQLYISINPRIYYTSLNMNGKVLHLYWIGKDEQINDRVLKLIQQNKIHMLIVHCLSVLEPTEFGQNLLIEVSKKLQTKSFHTLAGNMLRIYYIKGIVETDAEE